MMNKIFISVFMLVLLASCIRIPAQTPPTISTSAVIPTPPDLSILNCQPSAYSLPTLPAVIPGFNDLDESVGLHITGSYQIIDPETYRLKVSGKVKSPLDLSYDQIRCLPRVTANPLLICPGAFEDQARWTGADLKTVLDLAEVQAGAKELVLVSADGYQVYVRLSEALQPESLLAYEVNGQTLPILHGFPLRAVFPELVGGKWIKWLVEIQVH